MASKCGYRKGPVSESLMRTLGRLDSDRSAERSRVVMHEPDLWSWVPEITAYTDFMPWWNVGMERGANLTEQRDGVYVRWERVDQAQIREWEVEANVRGAQRYNWYVLPEGALDKGGGGARGRERWGSRPEGY